MATNNIDKAKTLLKGLGDMTYNDSVWENLDEEEILYIAGVHQVLDSLAKCVAKDFDKTSVDKLEASMKALSKAEKKFGKWLHSED